MAKVSLFILLKYFLSIIYEVGSVLSISSGGAVQIIKNKPPRQGSKCGKNMKDCGFVGFNLSSFTGIMCL